MFKDISIKGIAVGSLTVISTSVVLFMLMPLLFWDLIKTGKSDVLITSFWPQVYTLGVILISGVFGLYIGTVVANIARWINSMGIIIISLLITYIINQPVSEFASEPTLLFAISNYIACALSLLLGHFLSKKYINKLKPALN
ncbi:hypothetical protein ACOYR1_13030 [Thalassotalea piscium]